MPMQYEKEINAKDQPINGPTLGWLIEYLGVHRTYDLISKFAFSPVFIPINRQNSSSLFCQFINSIELKYFQKMWAGTYIRIPLAKDFRCRYMVEILELPRYEVAKQLQVSTKDIVVRLSRAQSYEFFNSDKLMELYVK